MFLRIGLSRRSRSGLPDEVRNPDLTPVRYFFGTENLIVGAVSFAAGEGFPAGSGAGRIGESAALGAGGTAEAGNAAKPRSIISLTLRSRVFESGLPITTTITRRPLREA